jgi:hypothetical protein
MLPGTLAMMLRQCVGYTVMARKNPVTSIALWLIIHLKRRSMTGRFPSRACQVGHLPGYSGGTSTQTAGLGRDEQGVETQAVFESLKASSLMA